MEQLSITVRAPDGPERQYLFSQATILIGRSPDCDIAIFHEAVPRHLCRVWLEDGGRRVRVEESPGLTNALELDGRTVDGGASGERLSLRVGPIGVVVRPAGADPGDARRGRRARIVRAAVGATAIAAAAALLAALADRPPRRVSAVDALPASLFAAESTPAPPLPLDARTSRESARLLASGAEEILSRASSRGSDRVGAVGALRRAAALYAASGDGDASGACEAEAERAAEELERAWRRDRLALSRSLAAGDHDSSSGIAVRMLGYLPPSEAESRRALLALVGPSRPSREGVSP